jgi:hypothetical protein
MVSPIHGAPRTPNDRQLRLNGGGTQLPRISRNSLTLLHLRYVR